MAYEYTLSATEAKKQYFLTPEDLTYLPHAKAKGWGAGQRRYYARQDLEEAALSKYGVEGLAAKRQKRTNRELNQKRKFQQAKEAEREMLARGQMMLNTTQENDENAVPAAVGVQALKVLRNDIVRSIKPFVSWDYCKWLFAFLIELKCFMNSHILYDTCLTSEDQERPEWHYSYRPAPSH